MSEEVNKRLDVMRGLVGMDKEAHMQSVEIVDKLLYDLQAKKNPFLILREVSRLLNDLLDMKRQGLL